MTADPAGFDVHDHRHRLKLLRNDGETELYENREEMACPACGDVFARLFLTRKPATTFRDNDGAPFCLVRGADGICLFRH